MGDREGKKFDRKWGKEIRIVHSGGQNVNVKQNRASSKSTKGKAAHRGGGVILTGGR